MTKKRYTDIETVLMNTLCTLAIDDASRKQAQETVMTQVRSIMKFDPERKTYTPELGKKIVAYRQKKAESSGVSMYEAFKGPEYYQKNKEALNKRNAEYRRRKANEKDVAA